MNDKACREFSRHAFYALKRKRKGRYGNLFHRFSAASYTAFLGIFSSWAV